MPNRGDCQSILGLAREVAVACNSQLKVPEFSVKTDEAVSSPSVRIEDPALSSLYSARRLELGLLKSTPIWMQRRLLAMGIRPIHIAVDITNYVMLEMGQPLHAFNADAVEGAICVRESKENESVVTLDEQNRRLPNQTTVIADEKSVLAIAGVMGGASSEVKPGTQSIILGVWPVLIKQWFVEKR